MKIGITCYPTYGGSGAVATELGLLLAERGHEVHFVSYAQPFRLNKFRERVFFHEVEMEDYPLFEHPPYALALAVALHDTAKKHELDLVHVHYAIPHATSFHAITRFSILRSHGLTAVSEFLKRETVRDFTVPDDRVEVIPNFIDTSVFRPGLEPCHRATLAPDGEKIVMHISNFRSVKRVEDVVATFARLNDKVPSRLVLVGDGPDRPRALMRAEELGVRDQVLFLGKHTSVHELLSCADLFLLPSENESFGLAALEAMACGAPVVASDAGGLPEVVVDGETGYLLDIGDIDGMADAGARILGDEDHWRRLSEGARAVAVERFSADRVVPQYEAYYDRVIKGGGE